MEVTVRVTKRAWVRDPNVPVGKPALGRFDCPCGGAPETQLHPDTGNITCACGTVYTWDGWIISLPPAVTDEQAARPADAPALSFTVCDWCGRTYTEGRPLICEGCKSNAFLHVVLA